MKRFVLVVTAAALAGTLIFLLPRPASPPEEALARMLDALQEGKISKSERYTVSGLGLPTDNRRMRKLYKALWSDMRYLVADTVTDGDSAEIVVSVTLTDMEALLAGTASDLLGRKTSEKKYHKLLIERVRSGGEDTVTSTVVVHLVKTKDGWRVDVENSKGFLAAVTGNMERK